MDTDRAMGVLYLAATPIGNMEDITYRVVRILGEVDLICAEDTRTSGKLMSHYDIHTPLEAYHEHNKTEKIPYLLQRLRKGDNIAVITDAGTPGISDPGEELVQACIEEGIEVFSLPGAVAAVVGLTSSGISSRRFAFEAFLPKNKKLRRRVLEELKNETRTIVIYEAPHHLKKTLEELSEHIGGQRSVALCRELTKLHEEKLLMTLDEAVLYYQENEPRGEYVVVIKGKSFEEVDNDNRDKYLQMSVEEHLQMYTKSGMSEKEAMKKVADDRGVPKREIYSILKR